MKIKYRLPILILIIFVLLAGSSMALAEEIKYPERGRYIYDEANALPLESELALSSYLWKLDVRTDYEIVVVFPKEVLSEGKIIQRFNELGVGKKGIDTGTAIFIFSDQSIFIAIGSGNNRVSVAQARTDGERILNDFDEEPVLNLLRLVNALAGRITEPITIEKDYGFGETVKENLHLIFLWLSVLSLIVFLIQQKDGFQARDLIAPVILFAVAGIFVVCSLISGSGESAYTKEYGVITATRHSTRDWIEMTTVHIDDKTTITVPVSHTDYLNYVTFLSYNLKPYQYVFRTTDSRSAWEHKEGELDALTVKIKDSSLAGVDFFNDRSGGKTSGDGVWLRR